MNPKSFRFSLSTQNRELLHLIKSKMLKTFAKPIKVIENNDLIKIAEQDLDKSISLMFKRYLNSIGFESVHLPTKFGNMHFYDSNPTSTLKPILFIHGLGSSAQSWWILAHMLKNKRRIVIPDLFHMSGFSIPNNPVMDFTDHAHSLIELIDNFTASGTKVDLCGLSLGGWLTLKLAATQKNKISRIILMNPAGLKINPFGLRDTFVFLSWSKFQKLYPGILKTFPYNGVPFISNLSKRSLYRNLKNDSIKDLLKLTKEEHFVDEQLKDIECPVLLLWGKEDHLLSRQIPVVLTNSISDINAYWIEKCAHVLALEAPVNCYKEICKFLNLTSIKDNSFAKIMLSMFKPFPIKPIEKKEKSNDY